MDITQGRPLLQFGGGSHPLSGNEEYSSSEEENEDVRWKREKRSEREERSETENSSKLLEQEVGQSFNLCNNCNQPRRDEKEQDAAVRPLTYAMGLAILFFAIELSGGIIANSLAVLTDAAHIMSDVAGFGVSLIAINIGRRKPTKNYSFGFHRFETIAALLSMLIVWITTAILCLQAVRRIQRHEAVDGKVMTIVASLGVFFNVLMLTVFAEQHHQLHGCGHDHGNGHNQCDHRKGQDQCDNNNPCGQEEQSRKNQQDLPCDLPRGHENFIGTIIKTPRRPNHQKKNKQYSRLYHQCDDPNCQNYEFRRKDNRTQHHQGEYSRDESDLLNKKDHDEVETEEENSLTVRNINNQNKNSNLNVRAAVAHIIGDLVQSIGVLLAGVIIWCKPTYAIADPICTFLFAILVLCTTWPTIKEIFSIFMESTPQSIREHELDLVTELVKLDGVASVYDVHVWALTSGRITMIGHLVTDERYDSRALLTDAQAMLRQKFEIVHTTLQIERIGDRTFCNCCSIDNKSVTACCNNV